MKNQLLVLNPVLIFAIHRNVYNTAYDLKNNWDEMIQAKTIERETQRWKDYWEESNKSEEASDNESVDEYFDISDTENLIKETHILPQIIVTNQDENETRSQKRLYDKNPKQSQTNNYKYEKNITEITELDRKTWKNKEIKFKKNEDHSPITLTKEKFRPNLTKHNRSYIGNTKGQGGIIKENCHKPPWVKEEEPVAFSKSYSFKKLPRGRVARLQRQFEQSTISEDGAPNKHNFGSPLPHLKTIKRGTTIRPKLVKIQPLIQIQTWEQKTNKSASNSYEEELTIPGSRKGFYASTPILNQDCENSLKRIKSDENLLVDEENQYINDYFDNLQDNRDVVSQRSSELFSSKIKQPMPLPYLQNHNHIKEKYFAFENIDLTGQVLSWTEIVSVQSVYDVRISEPIYV